MHRDTTGKFNKKPNKKLRRGFMRPEIIVKWVVVANRVEARVFHQGRPRNKLKLLKTFLNPDGRLHKRELDADRPGNGAGRIGGTALRPYKLEKGDSHEQAAIKFAKKIANYIKKERQNQNFDEVVIIAEPKFMGQLRSALDRPTTAMIGDWIKKDLHQADDKQILSHLSS